MRGVFIAEPSVAGFGRQLLNTVVEQVLKKSPAFCFLAEEHPAAKERVPALPGWRDCAGCGVGISQRVLKGVGMCCELENNVIHNTFIASIWSSPSQQQSLIVDSVCGSVPRGQGCAHTISFTVHHQHHAQHRHKMDSCKIELVETVCKIVLGAGDIAQLPSV